MKEEKREYTNLFFEVIEFQGEDVITESIPVAEAEQQEIYIVKEHDI
ncbi:MAG: hypothetical protein J5752_02545 [Clostridiales bacterium]|nr:hypothetical protein [Clostridiales bacterium]